VGGHAAAALTAGRSVCGALSGIAFRAVHLSASPLIRPSYDRLSTTDLGRNPADRHISDQCRGRRGQRGPTSSASRMEKRRGHRARSSTRKRAAMGSRSGARCVSTCSRSHREAALAHPEPRARDHVVGA
jgi:hypothetical protein